MRAFPPCGTGSRPCNLALRLVGETQPDAHTSWRRGYADAMVYRAISNLGAFIGHKDPATHRILVVGDFNLIHGAATERNLLSLQERDRTVFGRLQLLRFEYMGPQHPNGRVASLTPEAFRQTRKTFQRNTIPRPAPAARPRQQIGSTAYLRRWGFHRNVRAHVLNEPEQSGSSDHCRIVIEVSPETFPAGDPAT